MQNGVDAGCFRVLVCKPSYYSVFDLFNATDLVFHTQESQTGCILKNWLKKGFVYSFPCLLVANHKAAPEEAKCLAGSPGDGVDMDSLFCIILDDDTLVCCMLTFLRA